MYFVLVITLSRFDVYGFCFDFVCVAPPCLPSVHSRLFPFLYCIVTGRSDLGSHSITSFMHSFLVEHRCDSSPLATCILFSTWHPTSSPLITRISGCPHRAPKRLRYFPSVDSLCATCWQANDHMLSLYVTTEYVCEVGSQSSAIGVKNSGNGSTSCG